MSTDTQIVANEILNIFNNFNYDTKFVLPSVLNSNSEYYFTFESNINSEDTIPFKIVFTIFGPDNYYVNKFSFSVSGIKSKVDLFCTTSITYLEQYCFLPTFIDTKYKNSSLNYYKDANSGDYKLTVTINEIISNNNSINTDGLNSLISSAENNSNFPYSVSYLINLNNSTMGTSAENNFTYFLTLDNDYPNIVTNAINTLSNNTVTTATITYVNTVLETNSDLSTLANLCFNFITNNTIDENASSQLIGLIISQTNIDIINSIVNSF